MITLVAGIFAKMLWDFIPEWEAKKESKSWEKWEAYEDMREDMGVTQAGTVPIPKKWHKKVNPRKKHRA